MSQSRIMGKLVGDIYCEVALIPTATVMTSQGPGTCKDGTKFEYINGSETYAMSHQKYKAVDICGGDLLMYAPFKMTCRYHQKYGNAHISVFTSDNKVLCADGTTTYVTLSMVHGGEFIKVKDGTVNLSEGMKFIQGELCYKQGWDGLDGPKDTHVHINLKKGQVSLDANKKVDMKRLFREEPQKGQMGGAVVYAMNDDAYVEDIFHVLLDDVVSFTSTGNPWENHITFKSYANDWVLKNGEWYYYIDNTKQLGWIQQNGAWFYLDWTTGVMKKGWAADGAEWYYMNPENGHMVTGWLWDEGYQGWYFLNPNNGGAMQTYWLTDGGKKYYLGSDGKMYKDCRERINGVWYTFDNSGVATQG